MDLPRQLGHYTLTRELHPTKDGTLYLAVQQDVERPVLLELLQENSTQAQVGNFIQRARVRAGINFALLGVVYEANLADQSWYVTSEQLPGKSLQEIKDEGMVLSPKDFLAVIEAVFRVCDKYLRDHLNFDIIQLQDIYLTEDGKVRLANTALGGICPPEQPALQMQSLGESLLPIAPVNVPGATRLHTLCEWMSQGRDGTPMAWDQIHELVTIVREQLGLINSPNTQNIVKPQVQEKKSSSGCATAFFVVLLIVAAIFGLFYCLGKEEPPPAAAVPQYPDFGDDLQAEAVVTLDNGKKLIVGAHEVTIDAYAQFLAEWRNLSEGEKRRYNHPDQPDDYDNSHLPADWQEIHRAAKLGKSYKGKKLSERTPVFNVTFWDAWAFAAYTKAPDGSHYRLPSREEWQAVARKLAPGLKGDKTMNVDRYKRDFDHATGICGMASGVEEWTGQLERNPALPKEKPAFVICGGSRVAPGFPEPTYTHNPTESDINLGFRVVRDSR